MIHTITFSDELVTGPKPRGLDYLYLRADGIRSIIDLQPAPDDVDCNRDAEAELAHIARMDYCNLPIDRLDGASVGKLREALTQNRAPVYVHCRTGCLAGALVLMLLAAQHGWTPAETLDVARRRGFTCEDARMLDRVCNFAAAHALA